MASIEAAIKACNPFDLDARPVSMVAPINQASVVIPTLLSAVIGLPRSTTDKFMIIFTLFEAELQPLY